MEFNGEGTRKSYTFHESAYPTEVFLDSFPQSVEELNWMLKRHPHLREYNHFSEYYRRCVSYIRLKKRQKKGNLDDVTYTELARQYHVSRGVIGSWLRGEKSPELANMLVRSEIRRREYEARFSHMAFRHRIDPSTVYTVLEPLRKNDIFTISTLQDAIESLYDFVENKPGVTFAELRPCHRIKGKWLGGIAESIEDALQEIQEQINRGLGLDEILTRELRLGVVQDRLYFRIHDRDPLNWFNLYKNELFYFTSINEKIELMADARKRLGIHGDTVLSYLIDQITDYRRTVETFNQNSDLKRNHAYLRGETLHFLLDVVEMTIQDIQEKIDCVGRSYGNQAGSIRNPRFPDDQHEISMILVRLLGAGMSDGHIESRNKGFVYTESNEDRAEIFKAHMNELGEVDYDEKQLTNGMIRIRFPTIVGRMLARLGMPLGDKALSCTGLPRFIKEASFPVICEYFQQMWVEDGNFSVVSEGCRARFQWDRGVTFRDPSKATKYDFQSLASDDHIALVRRHGDKHQDKTFGETSTLTLGKLNELCGTKETNETMNAKSLKELIENNPPNLMEDEIELLAKLGVSAKKYVVEVNFYEGTGRLSALWRALTCRQEDTMRAALLTPPDDMEKLSDVMRWVFQQEERKQDVEHDLAAEGIDDWPFRSLE
ncbi:MAG: hypothetical protein KGY80_03395 [Candidatus Thorarchaeota archaeon]|nr:hypothetical protein [Candidatus Thorarchaeota archaeon]